MNNSKQQQQQPQSEPNQLISSQQGNIIQKQSPGLNFSKIINLAYSTLSDKKKLELTQEELEQRLTMVILFIC